jgi:hypothetical protein
MEWNGMEWNGMEWNEMWRLLCYIVRYDVVCFCFCFCVLYNNNDINDLKVKEMENDLHTLYLNVNKSHNSQS